MTKLEELLTSPSFWLAALPVLSALCTALLPALSDEEKARRMADSPRKLAARELAKAVLVDSPKMLANVYTLLTGKPWPGGALGKGGES